MSLRLLICFFVFLPLASCKPLFNYTLPSVEKVDTFVQKYYRVGLKLYERWASVAFEYFSSFISNFVHFIRMLSGRWIERFKHEEFRDNLIHEFALCTNSRSPERLELVAKTLITLAVSKLETYKPLQRFLATVSPSTEPPPPGNNENDEGDDDEYDE